MKCSVPVMSETDDTDILLLIPPNFFVVDSSSSEDTFLESCRTVVQKPVSCTAQVLGKLVDQVHSLESRLETLEIDTSNAFSTVGSSKVKTWDSDNSRSHERKCFTFPRRQRRKTRRGKRIDNSLTSLDSINTLEKSFNIHNFERLTTKSIELPLNDLQSMDGDISSIVSTPSKKNDKLLLHEIDEFLTKVESYESPDLNFKEQSIINPENVIQAAGDYISQKLDPKSSGEIQLPSGRTISSNVLDKYIYLVRNSANQSPQASTSTVTQQRPDNDTSYNTQTQHIKQDTKSPNIRKLNFSETKEVQPTSTPKRNNQPIANYSDTFKPSSNKILDRASKVLEHYKSQNYSRNTQSYIADASDLMSLKKEEFKMPQVRPFGFDRDAYKIDSIDTDLLSLSELWSEKPDKGERVENVKLEEERLKREHCEAMIQQLQRKLLEQQEKLAVAIKVDRAKDAAINKLKEAWLRLTGSLDKAEERHRSALDKMCREVDNFKMVADDAQKKTSHFETELYKALDLAHDYQEKCKQLTNEKKELQENLDKVVINRDDAIKLKEKEIEVLKENYETVMRLNKQSTDCVKNLEDALEKERSDHEQTKCKANELSNKLQSVNEEKSLIQQECDILKNKVNEERSRSNILEHQLCDSQNKVSELLKKCDTLENESKILKKHLELQKVELKNHYQQQLEDAVLGKLQEFQKQLELAERDMELASRNKEMHIVDTFNKQIVRIEEQHKLEVNVLEEKQREEIKLYRLQLAQASEKVGLLESKLESYRRRRGEIASQLHGVMEAQWRQALRILTSGVGGAGTGAGAAGAAGAAGTAGGTAGAAGGRALETSMVESVVSLPEYSQPPPLSLPTDALRSKELQFDQLNDHELQQYVKMLLAKPAHLDSVSSEGNIKEVNEEPTSDRPERRERARRTLATEKPPWKA